MEAIPVEVVGIILSHVAAARDVVVASTVCKKWRDAAQRYLRKLRFSSEDWDSFGNGALGTKEIEVLITQTVLQTPCLSHLSVCIGSAHHFSAAPVIAWLLYTRETLQSLTYMIYSDPGVNILDRCGRDKLEALVLGDITIPKVDLGIHKFPVLLSLTLKRVYLSSLDVNLIFSACPKLEVFTLINSNLLHEGSALELSSSSLKAVSFEDLDLDDVHVVLDAGKLEKLCIKYCTFEHLELLDSQSVRILKMAHCNIFQLDMGEEAEQLETVDISGFTLTWSKLHPILLRARKLETLRLWASPEVNDSVIDTETLATCFPRLHKLCLSYELNDDLSELVKGSSPLMNVSHLEVGSDVINEVYAAWIRLLVERCPNLRKLVVCGRLSEASDREDFRMISVFSSSIVDLMRQYTRVQIQFQFY